MRPVTTALTLAALLTAPLPLAAQTISAGLRTGFTYGGGDAWGQTFTAVGNGVLREFSFWTFAWQGLPWSYRAAVYRWDGTGVVGAALYSSDLQVPLACATCVLSDGARPTVVTTKDTFEPRGLRLTPDEQYVALILPARRTGDWEGIATASFSLPGNYAGGEAVWGFDQSLPVPTGDPRGFEWESFDSFGGSEGVTTDLPFEAVFQPRGRPEASVVPEPRTLVLLTTGLVLVMAGTSRRRRHVAAARPR